MKTSDKIYLEKDKETKKIDFRWGDRPVVHSAYEHIEYIRKDAILDWLKDRIKENEKCREICPSDRFFGGKEVAFEDVKDKINSL